LAAKDFYDPHPHGRKVSKRLQPNKQLNNTLTFNTYFL
jgi:hypothetical protein